ncbi:IclR family transcriptional regulator [Paenibacillus sp. 481]|uniref:IclR family transcriptional regulator n=1 Tax=Paenibacillus sp. 481 TaxID=2835869 RepID=UPI001E50EE5F|nr:IclR family transcriptional regulator C-terminal domain-containing protein [Paenibacillus sp. 481]UHA72457.1 helix-turn-helix domain-containing protein [Paenibacillus sp. 481]
MGQYEVATLKKGLQILELIKQQEALTLTEITNTLDLNKSTAFRLLATLAEMDYVYKFQNQFHLNHKMFCGHFERRADFDWVSLKSVYKLAKKLGQSVYIGKMDETNLVMTQVLHAPFTVPAQEEIGNRSRLHQSALGKVILANLPLSTQQKWLQKLSFVKATENTFEDLQLFMHHLKVIEKQGYAFDDEERVVGIRCIAVPLFKQEQVIAAVAIAAPKDAITRANMKRFVALLTKGSEAITHEIQSLIL